MKSKNPFFIYRKRVILLWEIVIYTKLFFLYQWYIRLMTTPNTNFRRRNFRKYSKGRNYKFLCIVHLDALCTFMKIRIMNQAEVPNKNTPITFLLILVRLICSLCVMNKIFGPKGIHNKRSWLYSLLFLFLISYPGILPSQWLYNILFAA